MCADPRCTTSCVRIITFIRVKLLLKPWTMPDGSECWGHGGRSPPATSPSQTVLAITVNVPGHVTTLHVTRQLITKKPHDVLQELTRPSPCYWIGKCVVGMLGYVSISRRWYSEITLQIRSAIILLSILQKTQNGCCKLAPKASGPVAAVFPPLLTHGCRNCQETRQQGRGVMHTE
jgi:hypothetical protein